MRFKACLLLCITLIPLLLIGCSSSDKETEEYSDYFVSHMDDQIDTCNDFFYQLTVTDYDSDEGISSLRDKINQYSVTFNTHLAFYQSPYPVDASPELIEAVEYAREGTTSIISALSSMDSALENSDYEQMNSAGTTYDSGVDKINAAADKFNEFADTYNANLSGSDIGLGILIGTGVLWGLNLLVVNPIVKRISKRNLVMQPVDGQATEGQPNITSDMVDNRTYIMVDTIVLGIAGLTMGLAIGWFFIGLTWKARQWPGLIAFIGLSFLGSYLHG